MSINESEARIVSTPFSGEDLDVLIPQEPVRIHLGTPDQALKRINRQRWANHRLSATTLLLISPVVYDIYQKVSLAFAEPFRLSTSLDDVVAIGETTTVMIALIPIVANWWKTRRDLTIAEQTFNNVHQPAPSVVENQIP